MLKAGEARRADDPKARSGLESTLLEHLRRINETLDPYERLDCVVVEAQAHTGAAGSAATAAHQCTVQAQAAGGDGCDRGLARAAGPLKKKGSATNAVELVHVPLAYLPEKWRARFNQTGSATVTVRIEEEAQAARPEEFITDDPLFVLWRDREDRADVAGYVRKLRASLMTLEALQPSKVRPPSSPPTLGCGRFVTRPVHTRPIGAAPGAAECCGPGARRYH